MQSIWSGSIILPGSDELRDIAISACSKDARQLWHKDVSLEFLSVVETARIPLHIILGAHALITTSDTRTQRWFESILLTEKGLDHEDSSEQMWWNSARPDSPLGVLLGVRGCPAAGDDVSGPRTTELLVIASREAPSGSGRPPTPPLSSPEPDNASKTRPVAGPLRLYALPLSSDLLQRRPDDDTITTTPPASPLQTGDTIEGTFISSTFSPNVRPDVIDHPPVRKRKSVTDAFDAATERQRKARRQGSEDVAAVAATSTGSSTRGEAALPPSLKYSNNHHRRSVSHTPPVPLPLHKPARPLSRASSVAISTTTTTASSSATAPVTARPASAREQFFPAHAKRSSLSRFHSVPESAELSLQQETQQRREHQQQNQEHDQAVPPADDVEGKNKDLVSRVVMAGMRLHGLSQSKSRRAHAGSAAGAVATSAIGITTTDATRRTAAVTAAVTAAASPVLDAGPSDGAEPDQRKRDDEFKLVYHQVYKGTCFAFREHLARDALAAHTGSVREVVDGLLALYCTDPLANLSSTA